MNTYSWLTQKWDAEVVIYANYIDDYIYSRPGGITNTVRGAFPFFLYEQTDALFLGADISAKLMHSNTFYSRMTGSYLWAKDVANSSFLPTIPPPNIAYNLHYHQKRFWKLSELDLGLSISYTFEQFQHPRTIGVGELLKAKVNDEELFSSDRSTFDFLDPPAAYTLVNAFLSFDVNPFRFSLKATNLFNVSYRSYTDRMRYFADDAGVNFELNLNYSF